MLNLKSNVSDTEYIFSHSLYRHFVFHVKSLLPQITFSFIGLSSRYSRQWLLRMQPPKRWCQDLKAHTYFVQFHVLKRSSLLFNICREAKRNPVRVSHFNNQQTKETHAGWHGAAWAGPAGGPYVLDITLLSMSPFPDCPSSTGHAFQTESSPGDVRMMVIKFYSVLRHVSNRFSGILASAGPPMDPVQSHPLLHGIFYFLRLILF